jgi:hypothetical protein
MVINTRFRTHRQIQTRGSCESLKLYLTTSVKRNRITLEVSYIKLPVTYKAISVIIITIVIIDSIALCGSRPCSYGFCGKSLFRFELSTVRQSPAILEDRCYPVRVFSLSWQVPILKRLEPAFPFAWLSRMHVTQGLRRGHACIRLIEM